MVGRLRFEIQSRRTLLVFAYVTEDRKGLGLHTSLSSVCNVTMANLKHYGLVLLNKKRERTTAEAWKGDLDVRTGSLEAPVGEMSGGNQQKISIAKWLDTKPKNP